MNTATLIAVALCVLALNIRTTYQQQCVTILDLILAIDGSNSMGEPNFMRQLTSVENLLRPMNISEDEIHVGLILFSGDIRATAVLSGDKNMALSELRSMGYPDEETRTDMAIDTAVDMFHQYGRNGSVPKLLMLVTDGVPTKPHETIKSADRAKQLGINIFVIAVTDRADVTEMKKIASVKNRVFVTENFDTLEASLNNATYRACVDLKCQDANIDIVFVMDSSSTTGATNFQEMKTFVHEFLQFADVDSGEIRVAIVTYSDTANVQFYLNTYHTKVLMNNAINSLQYQPGGANLADALRLLRTNVFTRNSGDRPDVNNVVILLSANDVSSNLALASAEADATRAAGIQIFGVGIGHRNSHLMDNVVSRPQEEHRFMINTFQQLRPLISEVYNKFNRFCESPPPVPACNMGRTDIWYVVDVSQTAERLSRFQFTGDFYWLKNGLTKMIEIVQDPSVSNPGVRLGLTAYSDSSRLISDATKFNSVNDTARAVQQLPAGIAQGGAALVSALQNIVSPAVISDYRSYVTVVAPESSYVSSMTSLERELTRLKGLGYTVAVIVVTESGSLDQLALQRYASGPKFVYNIARYSDLEAATKNFTRDRLCSGLKDNSTGLTAGLCAGSGHMENGVGVVAHPMDCDKYIQCYYNQRGELDLGVVRQCPMGLHFNSASKICSKPDQARCAYDRCQESCQQYKMSGSCRAYWDCEDSKSTPQCCPENYAFVPGKGCQPDSTCKDLCGPFKSCSMCQKKPVWDNRAGYDVRIFGGNMWIARPCFHDDFNILDCGCTAPRDQACPADRVFDFTDVQTLRAIDEGRKEGIRVYDVQKVSGGVVLGNRSAVHVSVNHMEGGNEPFALEFRFRELDTFSPYGETLVSSGFTCGNANFLHISADDQFIFAEIRSSRGQLAEVKVPTKGLNKEEFKDLVLSYDTGVLSLSIKDEKTQYIAKTEAPSNICLACGLDIGRGLNKLSFDGEIQKIAVYSCAWPLLYSTDQDS
ncbi:hypothetical protein BsWGS_07278 [Bradybaena similaris]